MQKSYVSKPGCIEEVSEEKVDTNIYDVVGWGSLNTEKTDSTDLNTIQALNFVQNIHITTKFNISFKPLLSKIINYFYNSPIRFYYVGSVSLNNNRFTVNNIPFHFDKNNSNIDSDGNEEFLAKYMNHIRPFIDVVKCYRKDNKSVFKHYWLNKFSQKLNSNFWTLYSNTPSEMEKWNLQLNNKWMIQGEYTYIFYFNVHNTECKGIKTDYYCDAILEDSSNYSKKYKDFGRFNYIFANAYPCYDYPGAENNNRCAFYNFTDPDGNYKK